MEVKRYKRLLLFSIILLFVTLIITKKTTFFYQIRELYSPNKIIVEAINPLQTQKVTITWISELSPVKDTLYLNGKNLNKIFKEYGKNDFEIFYDNKKIGTLSHLKLANWHGHTYKIKVYPKSDVICIKAEAEGEDKIFSYNSSCD